MREQYFVTFGTTLNGLRANHGVDPEEYLAFVHDIPLDRLLVETDSPYLAPVPHRGKRNEPAFLLETVKQIALLHGVAPEVVAAQVRANCDRLLGVSRVDTSAKPVV